MTPGKSRFGFSRSTIPPRRWGGVRSGLRPGLRRDRRTPARRDRLRSRRVRGQGRAICRRRSRRTPALGFVGLQPHHGQTRPGLLAPGQGDQGADLATVNGAAEQHGVERLRVTSPACCIRLAACEEEYSISAAATGPDLRWRVLPAQRCSNLQWLL